MWWGEDDNFVVDQSERGFASLIDQMAAPYQDVLDTALMFGATVTNVAYDADGVVAMTADGRTFRARVALATFPLGHLQANHASLFTPPLDDDHVSALTSEGE